MGFVGRIFGGPESIRTALNNRGLSPSLFFTIHRLNGISKTTFNSLLSLIDKLEIKKRFKFNDIKLILPSAGELNRIDFEKFLENDTAIWELKQRTSTKIIEKKTLDLRELTYIYVEFVINASETPLK